MQANDQYWAEQAKQNIDWITKWDTVSNCNLSIGKVEWYVGGELNACYNCVDRHAYQNPDQLAIIWEGNNPEDNQQITYRQLHVSVCKTANILKKLGVKKGERVCLYMPMTLDIVYTMLACARIGAIHSVVFAGFSADSLRTRILDCGSKIVITSTKSQRGTKTTALLENVTEATQGLTQIEHIIVTDSEEYRSMFSSASEESDYIIMNAEDPLFILYTSGSTGKPKGVQHSTGGYLTYAASTFKLVFDYKPGEIYWCTADAGWITGHTYFVYGPLASGATILMYEGVPTYPTASRMWEIIDKYKVNIFYTAPTLIRSLMAHGDKYLTTTTRDSLRILGTVGEPINPAAWDWYYKKIGNSKCPIVDTWWQTETGGILISPIPNQTKLKAGSATLPLPGITPSLLDEKGIEINGEGEGYLVIKESWPGQMQALFNNHDRFIKTYFDKFPGYYFAGDSAKRDRDGYYWIIGRVDDVLNVSGHRIGTAEVESALVKHYAVAEAAVVGIPDDITGESLYAFVCLMDNISSNENLSRDLKEIVKKEIGSFASPKVIHFTKDLPKTRSGKIMRRILRKIACGDINDLGDVSTLGNPEVIKLLLNNHQS